MLNRLAAPSSAQEPQRVNTAILTSIKVSSQPRLHLYASFPVPGFQKEQAMLAKEIMTREIITVRPETSIQELAQLMTERRISGVPVVDAANQLLGIVSVSDLVHRVETGTQRKRKWWAALFTDAQTLARDFVKTHGTQVSDLMTRKVVCVSTESELRHVADVLDRHGVKRVPVLEGGKLVGLISRSDLVRAVAQAAASGTPTPALTDDGAVQKALIERMDAQPWLSPSLVTPVVAAARIELYGYVASEDQRRALLLLTRELAGPREVKDELQIGIPAFGEV
jgi:CBS domain-containing protein